MFDFISERFSSLVQAFGRNKRLTEDNIQEALTSITDALLEADVPYALATTFVNEVKQEVIAQKVIGAVKPGDQFIKVVHDRIKQFLGAQEHAPFALQAQARVMVLGLQGSGKTTSLAKLATWAITKQQISSRAILVASVDYYRPAAIDQLEQLAKQVGVAFYRARATQPVAATREIMDYARTHGYTALFLDTAGRLHVDNQMLDELKEVVAQVQPTHKILVLDAMTGQESLAVAKAFNEAVGFDAAILSKMDSDTRGGAAFSFKYALKKPIAFVGTGEKLADLEPFHPDRVAGRMLDMGDIVTLVEKAEQCIKKDEQEEMDRALTRGELTLQDFAKQMDMMQRIGSMGNILKYLPGMQGFKITPDMLRQGELEMKKFRAIINSMTPKERLQPKVLTASRKERIARGAGVQVADVTNLIMRFEETKQYVKLMSKVGASKGFFR
jgi:signal recognition particle subunit SRP54